MSDPGSARATTGQDTVFAFVGPYESRRDLAPDRPERLVIEWLFQPGEHVLAGRRHVERRRARVLGECVGARPARAEHEAVVLRTLEGHRPRTNSRLLRSGAAPNDQRT